MTARRHWGYRELSLATPEGLLQWSLPHDVALPEQQPWLSRLESLIQLCLRMGMAPGHRGFPSLSCIRGSLYIFGEKRTGCAHFDFFLKWYFAKKRCTNHEARVKHP
jgi:hypothetical protein